MKLTLRQIAMSVPGFNELSRKEMPIKVSFAVARNLKQLQEEQQLFEKKRTELFEKYGNPVEGGQPGQYQVKPESIDEFQKAQNELLDCEVDVDVTTIDPETLESSGVKLKPETFVTLSFMFKGLDD